MSTAPQDRVAALAKAPLFTDLTPPQLESLASRVKVRTYRAGEIVFHRDDPGFTFHIIHSGLVKIYVTSPEGQEVVLIILKPGDFFGELSLFDGAPRSASAVAMAATETFTLDRDGFLDFIVEQPAASLTIFAVMASRIRRADGIIADAAFLDLPARVCKQLLELSELFGRETNGHIEIELKLRQQDFASMVSATRESVNRTLSGLEEEGIIRLERQHITILRPEVLRRRIPLAV
jgi:CRP-like cAMP-binding protein